ncbi:MAG TPA: hypothetical protein VJ063_17490 [Verrucomicrobiae bacterium]|nr:hypothetical protein [Verrucomicrobiae bacterium]
MSVKVVVALFSIGLGVLSLTAEPIDASKVSPSIAQVVKMHDAGVADDVLLAYVKETPISKPSAEEVLYLTEKGIPKDVIVTLLSKRVWTETPAPQSQPQSTQQAQPQSALPPAVAPAQPATQSTVYVQQPAPVVTYVAPAPYYYYPYYRPYYYGPTFSFGIGLGHSWGGSHWHHGGGVHLHHR